MSIAVSVGMNVKYEFKDPARGSDRVEHFVGLRQMRIRHFMAAV